jgi:hypothetical protein
LVAFSSGVMPGGRPAASAIVSRGGYARNGMHFFG